MRLWLCILSYHRNLVSSEKVFLISYDKLFKKYFKIQFRINYLKGEYMTMEIKVLKWTATILTLSGILTFYLDYYPYSMIPHGLGIICWTVVGTITKDKPLLANFSLQIPIIIAGIIKYFHTSWYFFRLKLNFLLTTFCGREI